jgi:CBS domain-containing protein
MPHHFPMDTVKDLLDAKGHEVYSVKPNATVYEALELMAERNLGAVMVVDEKNAVKGIFSERDYARKIIIKGRASRTTRVKEIMTAKVLYVEPSTTVRDCMTLMTGKRIRHLPVMDGGKLVGVVSIGDVVKAHCSVQESVISQQEFRISQLERYISGGM